MESLKFERLTILLHVLAWAILFFFSFFGRDTYPLRFILKSTFHIFYIGILFLCQPLRIDSQISF